MKVFIYLEKYFFSTNGFDYMAALDDDKVKTFFSEDDAQAHLKKNVETCRDLNPGASKSKFADKNCFGVTITTTDHRRFVFEIISQDVEL